MKKIKRTTRQKRCVAKSLWKHLRIARQYLRENAAALEFERLEFAKNGTSDRQLLHLAFNARCIIEYRYDKSRCMQWIDYWKAAVEKYRGKPRTRIGPHPDWHPGLFDADGNFKWDQAQRGGK